MFFKENNKKKKIKKRIKRYLEKKSMLQKRIIIKIK
jgi:hypothetical protein